ncbi:hypothetical protein V5735_07830 (plasmid) [Haladaptatus sp. SPP-AMP-3]|uniref:DUF7504 family protein n=1 Tax=Haladaptatus sp. SPP-AMP-3 TaxID=3121295 RepID=UPI003C2E88A6
MTSELQFRGDDPDSNFQTWLQRLKQRGSNILVTGNVPDWISAKAARVLFGYGERRYRILALIDRTIDSPESRLPKRASPADATTWIIDQRNGERSIPTAAVRRANRTSTETRNEGRTALARPGTRQNDGVDRTIIAPKHTTENQTHGVRYTRPALRTHHLRPCRERPI